MATKSLKVTWSPNSETGVEGSAIGLGAVTETIAGLTPQSLMIGSIPVGARLSDGTHSFTATKGSTSVDVTGWTLSNMAITPINDTNFTLKVSATGRDARGRTYTATATEAVTVNPLMPTVTWSPGSAAGFEGSAVALGPITDTINGLPGDKNTLKSLVISAVPVETILSDGTHSFAAAAGSTSVDVTGWSLSGLTITAATPMTFALKVTATAQDADGNTSSRGASKTVAFYERSLAATWSPVSETGVEGTAISLGTITETMAGLTPLSLVVAGVPAGATLSDGRRNFTATADATSVDVSGWNLSGLTITPVNDANFTLTATATAETPWGSIRTASASQTVAVDPLAPTVAWSPASVTGPAGSAISLGTLSDTVNGFGGDGNSLQSLVIAGIPAGATLADGGHSFTAASGSNSVNMAGWDLSHLTMMAASAMTFTATASAIVQDAEGDTSGASAAEAVTIAAAGGAPPPSGTGTSPPGGTPQHPNLFAGYAVRPPWQVAGVDYPVGVPVGTVLKDPTVAANLPVGASIDNATHTINISANNVTLNGFDFSLHGGYRVYISGAYSGIVIENCKFGGTNTNNVGFWIQAAPNANGLTIINSTFDGGPDPQVYYQGGGNFTAENNIFENAAGDAIDFGSGTIAPTVKYNLFYNLGTKAGSHPDTVQYGGGAITNNAIESFNTIYQPQGGGEVSGEEGIQICAWNGATINNATVANNVIIASGPALTMSYLIAIYPQSGGIINGVTVANNYLDSTGAYGPFYPPSGNNLDFTNNINILTGAQIHSPI
jgi:Right handed beta helix region